MKKQIGYSIIELVIFISVIAITVPIIVAIMFSILTKFNTVQYQNPAIESASQCLEWFLNVRYNQGYAAITCPSTTVPTLCSIPNGYSIAVNVSCLTLGGDANYKQINVTVSGKGNANETLVIANY